MKKIFTLLLLSLISCHPNSGSVVNRPPVIENKPETYGITQGKYKPDFFSAVLWPANWSENDYEKGVKTVNIDSQKLLNLLNEKQMQPAIQINTLWRQFRMDLKCIENFHDDSSPADPTLYNEDSSIGFVVLTPVAPVPEVPLSDPNYSKYQEYLAYQTKSAALAACQTNFNTRAGLHDQINAFLSADPSPTGAIQNEMTAILGDDSSLAIIPEKSLIQFRLKEGVIQASIRIEKFQNTKKTVSSETDDPALKITGVTVSATVDHLTFTIPDVTKPGITYVFDLVRVEPLYSFDEFEDDGSSVPTEEAIFKGDMTMMVGGIATRTGSALIVGTLKPFPASPAGP